jgi:hypothetical protein
MSERCPNCGTKMIEVEDERTRKPEKSEPDGCGLVGCGLFIALVLLGFGGCVHMVFR